MIYRYIFCDSISTESVTALATWLNSVPEEAKIVIYFSCSGGGVDSAEVLLDLLEGLEPGRLLLHCFGSVVSAGLFVALKYCGLKTMRFGTIAMAHLIYEETPLLHDGRPRTSREANAMSEFPAWQIRYDEVICPVLTPAQIVEYQNGLDVWIGSEQLWEAICKTRK